MVFLITFSLDSISSCRNLTTYHHTHEEGIISLPGMLTLKCRYSNLNLFFFFRSVISPFSFWGSLSTPSFYHLSHLFFGRRQMMLINKRRNSDPAAAGASGNSAKAPRQTEKTATDFVYLLLYDGAFWDLCVFSRSMGLWKHEGGVSRRTVNKNSVLKI